jgi:hypothetical protein
MSRFLPSRQHKCPLCIVGVWIFLEYDFQTIHVFPQQEWNTQRTTTRIFLLIKINLTVETFFSLEQIVIFPCDCLDFHEIGYRETMIKLVDNDLPFQYYVKGTLLIN